MLSKWFEKLDNWVNGPLELARLRHELDRTKSMLEHANARIEHLESSLLQEIDLTSKYKQWADCVVETCPKP